MIKNYLLLFVRNLRRQKLFSFINLLGLTVSIVSTLMIYLYVRHEFSFDRFHHNVDRIYRVNQTFIWGEASNQFASTGPGVAVALAAELPEVELMTSIHTPGNFIVSYSTPSQKVISFEEDKILMGDTNFFKMFNFPLLKGRPDAALRQAQTMVMTESTAKKYFGDADPIGKLVRLGGVGSSEAQKTYEVTGVIKDTPDNSYIEFDILLSMNSYPIIKQLSWSWVWTQLETYIRLEPSANVETTRLKLAKIPKVYVEETLRRAMNTSYDEYIKSGKKWELFLQPMTSIHLPPQIVYNRLNDSGNLKVIYSFIGAAIFIILLSCVNFMNLSMAQFTRRIKEASVRKVLGLRRDQLSLNYFVEALIFCALAFVTALALSQLLLPGFNYVTGKSLRMDFINDPGVLLLLIGLILFMAIMSSSYPAAFLTAFHPVEGMKGKLKRGREGKGFRNGLVVFQFSVSIVLMVCTAVVFQQLSYVSEKDLGFDKQNLMVVPHVEGIRDSEGFVKATKNISGVVESSWCTSVPPTIWGGDTFTAEGTDKTFPLNFTKVDDRFLTVLDIRLRFGRNFSESIPGDAGRVILNETAVRKIGWALDESVLGKKIAYGDDQFEVVGVVADFNYWSLTSPIEPMGLFSIHSKQPQDSERQYMVARIDGKNKAGWESTIAQIQNLWKVHGVNAPFEYSFIDQTFAETFKTQEQFGKVLTVMAALAILIACLGLLGIIIYSLEHRSKEIGIRKVSGASVWNILTLISGGYARLIALAFVLSAPLSYWMMNEWLQDFAYRVKPSLWIFIIAGSGTLALAFLITGFHSVKAALVNPVTVLRDE